MVLIGTSTNQQWIEFFAGYLSKIGNESMNIFSLTFPINCENFGWEISMFWLKSPEIFAELRDSVADDPGSPTRKRPSLFACDRPPPWFGAWFGALLTGAYWEWCLCVWSCGISRWTYGYPWYPMVICVSYIIKINICVSVICCRLWLQENFIWISSVFSPIRRLFKLEAHHDLPVALRKWAMRSRSSRRRTSTCWTPWGFLVSNGFGPENVGYIHVYSQS